MNFQFNEDQDMLRNAAKKLLGDMATLEQAHQHIESGSGYDVALWTTMAENGWQGLTIPEEFGGSGMTYLDLAVIAEELGYHYAHTPYSSSIVGAAEAILLAGSEEQKNDYLPRLATGELIGSLALFEKTGRHDAQGIDSVAENNELTGCKAPVSDGLYANFVITAANTSKGLSLFLVDLDCSEVSREAMTTIELTRGQAEINFKGAKGQILGEEGKGELLLAQLLNRVAVLVAFEQLGGAQRCLDMARDYALERYAFGRPIGSYQAIKHRLADMYVKIEMARSNCFYAAWAMSSSEEHIAEAAAMARISVIEAYSFAAQENVQIHGGIGFTWEADPHLFLKRMKLQEALYGPASMWKEKLFKILDNQ